MKRSLSLLLVVFFMSTTSYGQFLQKNGGANNGSITGVKANVAAYSSTKSQVGVLQYDDGTITSNLGTGGTFTTNAFAYFPASAFTSWVGNTIFKISVGVGAASSITSLQICIWTDTSSHGANPIMTQTVTGLSDGWNEFTLTTPYTLTSTAGVFVGYKMTTGGYSLSCDAAATTGGFGDMLQNPTTGAITHLANIGTSGFGDLSIKAHVGSLDAVEAELVSIDNNLNISTSAATAIDITGTIKNNGTSSITSYDVAYTINGGTAVATQTITPATAIVTGATESFTHNVTADLSTAGAYIVELYISNINGAGNDADVSNDTLSATINSVANLIQKKVLHEVLTSSTCAPCAGANPVIDGVVFNNNAAKATLIKYQVSWPGAGDPYQNAESAARVAYYGTTGVPDFKVGGSHTESGVAYTQQKLDAYAILPAIATVAGTATLSGTTVSVNVDYDAISDITGALVGQIVVIEKKTVKNVGSNGETEFHNVMMKFIPGTAGNPLTNFTTPYATQNITKTQDLTGTNVEWLGNLRIIAWLQDNTTKEVYQSEYIEITSTDADAGVTEVSTVSSSCGLPSANDVTFTVHNGGFVDLTGVVVSYTIGGGAVQTVSVAGTLTIGSDATVTVTGVDFSAIGNHDIVAYTTVNNDNWKSNDTITYHLDNITPAAIPYAEQFSMQTLGWNILDVNNDGKTWRYVEGTNYGHGDKTAYFSNYNASQAADDYLFSTCLDLVGGTSYDLNFWYHMGVDNGTPYPEKLKVLVGTSADAASMTQTVIDLGTISNGTYQKSHSQFTVPTSGSYYLGFHTTSAANMWYTAIDDISIGIATAINTSSNQNYRIYPNPTTGIIVIEGAKDSQVTVYNMIGEVVYSTNNATDVTKINLSSFSAGNYFVKIVNEKEVSYQKIMLTK